MENKLYVVGDIHGKFSKFSNLIYGKSNATYILAGDVGLGFHTDDIYENWFLKWNEELKENNIILYFMRGNHDDPSYWNEDKINYSNIRLVKDYETLNINNKNILCVGGAISIDRKYRKEGYTYWKDEKFTLDESKLNSLNNIDIVISHTSPSFSYPRDNNTEFLRSFYQVDANLKNELTTERLELDVMYNILKSNNKITEWYYGHFHDSKIEYHDNILFRLCDINEIVEI